MTREQKINLLKAVKAGIPVKRAMELFSSFGTMVHKEKGDPNLYFNGELITQKEIDIYNRINDLPMIIFENVSEQFKTDKYGNVIGKR